MAPSKVRVMSNAPSPYLKLRSRHGTITCRSGTNLPLKQAILALAGVGIGLLLRRSVQHGRATTGRPAKHRRRDGRKCMNAMTTGITYPAHIALRCRTAATSVAQRARSRLRFAAQKGIVGDAV